MKETKVYVDELPKSCCICHCFDTSEAMCSITGTYTKFKQGRILEDCPLKSLHDYKKELVAKVLEKIKMLAKDNFDFDMCNECGEFVHNDNVLTESDFNKILDQIQKEFEDGK